MTLTTKDKRALNFKAHILAYSVLLGQYTWTDSNTPMRSRPLLSLPAEITIGNTFYTATPAHEEVDDHMEQGVNFTIIENFITGPQHRSKFFIPLSSFPTTQLILQGIQIE